MFTTSKKASHKKKYTHTHAQTTEWFTHCGQMPLDCEVVNQSVVRARLASLMRFNPPTHQSSIHT